MHPHQVHQAVLAIASTQNMQEFLQDKTTCQPTPTPILGEIDTIHSQGHENVQQGSTLKCPAGIRVYSDASWQKKNIPGRGDSLATGVGVHIHIPEEEFDTKNIVQASTDSAHSPVVAEALAL